MDAPSMVLHANLFCNYWTLQNSALSMCLVANRTSPAASLLVESGDIPLELKRNKLKIELNTLQPC